MAGGRPTKYNEEILEKAKEYIVSCSSGYEQVEIVRKHNRTTGKGEVDIVNRVKLPTIEGLSVYLEVSRDTLYEWADKHKEFSYTLEAIKTSQAENLINKGLSGEYNSTIAKLMLSSNHGMSEKSESKVEHSGGINLTDLFDKSKED